MIDYVTYATTAQELPVGTRVARFRGDTMLGTITSTRNGSVGVRWDNGGTSNGPASHGLWVVVEGADTTPEDTMSMTYAQAAALVTDDQRQNDGEDEATDADILAYVRNTVTLPHVHAVGGWPIEDTQDALSAAYVLIVATTDEGAAIAPFTPTASHLAEIQARGHLIRSGHRLTGYYVTVGGLSTLIRTCDHTDD